MLNAFAGPGGHVFLFSGLIDVMKDTDELAAVLSHEIGHVSARHLARRIEMSRKLGFASLAGILAGILIGGDAGKALHVGTAAANTQVLLHYSREDERQADVLGIDHMSKTGFDPSHMITLLTHIQSSHWPGADQPPPYLLTHPTSPERISNIETILAGSTGSAIQEGIRKFKKQFPYFKTIIKVLFLDTIEAEKQFQRALEKNPKSVTALFGMGIVNKERAEYQKACDYFQMSLEGDPDSLPVLQKLAEVYQMTGQDQEAITIIKKALALENQDTFSLYILAKSFQNMEEYQKAVQVFERLKLMNPAKDEIYYQLGISYGRLEKLALAHYHFGIFYTRIREVDKAKFHFNKAMDLAKDDELLKKRIQNARNEMGIER